MKTLTKTEHIKRWLKSGKPLRQHQAKVNWNCERLAPVIERFRKGLKGHEVMPIIDIGKPGDYSNYLMLEKGLIRNRLFKGYRLTVINFKTISGDRGQYKDMNINIVANNGHDCKTITVNQDAFRDKKIMIKAIENGN
jgi:hypothetical protein